MDLPAGVLVASLLALAPVLSARAEEPVPADWRIERIDREVKVPADAALTIGNRWGDLRVRAGEAGRVLLHAVVQHHAEDPRELAIETTEVGGGLRLDVSWSADEPTTPGAWARRRADLAVEVPAHCDLRIRTEEGLIEVKGHAGPLQAGSAAGDLRLRVAGGPLSARTERGSILAVLAAESWNQAARFEAPSGDVEVQFPARTDASVVLETQGALTTDFSLEVEHVGPLAKRARARLGRGGGEVLLQSRRGDLRILLLPDAPAPAGSGDPRAPGRDLR
jgi:hypothetical protein